MSLFKKKIKRHYKEICCTTGFSFDDILYMAKMSKQCTFQSTLDDIDLAYDNGKVVSITKHLN